jgi:site-specific DNA recombinase
LFELFLELHSCRKVAEALNAEGVVTKGYRTKTGKDFGGKPWKGRTVYEHLTDRKYVGQIVHKDKAYPGEHLAIVKADLFEKVQEVLRANKTYTHRHQVRRSALLRGLLRCGECGSLIQPAWTTNHGREYRYYACSRRVKTGYDKCGLPTLPAGEIETMVVDQLRALLRHPDVIARTYREIQERSSSGPSQEATDHLAQLCQRREQLRESIRVLLGLAKQNEFMSDELKRLNGELNALDRSIGQLEREPAPTGSVELADVTDALQRIDPIWEVLHPDEQRRVLELLVEMITVSKERVEVQFRANGIEQIAHELDPIGARSDD